VHAPVCREVAIVEGFNIKKLCILPAQWTYVPYDFNNKRRLFSSTAFTGWSLPCRRIVFPVRYELKFINHLDDLWYHLAILLADKLVLIIFTSNKHFELTYASEELEGGSLEWSRPQPPRDVFPQPEYRCEMRRSSWQRPILTLPDVPLTHSTRVTRI
jgi:hypothetical protein